MFIKRTFIFALLSVVSSVAFGQDDWVKVPPKELVVHQLEQEDHSIWVVFSKTMGSDRVLVRFPEDPTYRHHVDGHFEAFATHLGVGELSLSAKKKNFSSKKSSAQTLGEVIYRDIETGRWIMEKHIETDQFLYVLRFSHPSQSTVIFRQFVDSFEVEKNQ